MKGGGEGGKKGGCAGEVVGVGVGETSFICIRLNAGVFVFRWRCT